MKALLLLAVLLGACSASRPAATAIPAASSGSVSGVALASGNPSRQTGPPVPPLLSARLPVVDAATDGPAPATAQPSPEPTDATWIVSGILAHMGSSPVGRLYLAIPEGPGVRVRLCAARCLTLTSTDVGPSLAMQRIDRIADVSVYLFERVCGLPASRGLCAGTMEGPVG